MAETARRTYGIMRDTGSLPRKVDAALARGPASQKLRVSIVAGGPTFPGWYVVMRAHSLLMLPQCY
jgi:hypothetical protein